MAKSKNEAVVMLRNEVIDRQRFGRGDQIGEVDEAGEVVSTVKGVTPGHVVARLSFKRAARESVFREAERERERENRGRKRNAADAQGEKAAAEDGGSGSGGGAAGGSGAGSSGGSGGRAGGE